MLRILICSSFIYASKVQLLKLKISNIVFIGADVNLADYVGKTPLYICVNNCIVHTYSGKTAVQKLISAGAIVDK